MRWPDSEQIAIRPLVPQDGNAFQSFVTGLSDQSRSNRFLVPVRELAPASLQTLTQADQRNHIALVATEGGHIVAEGRYVAMAGSNQGEFAIAVADHLQRQGIGARILDALMAAGRRAGLALLTGEVLKTNTAMLGFAQQAGFRFRTCPGDATLAIVERDLWQGLRP